METTLQGDPQQILYGLKLGIDYICLFIVKNRYGRSNVQLVYERNMAFNTYIEIGFTEVEYDGFGR